jgi:predicted glycoside hydrolase/deacetylase ChbG (UPF0249 family)
MLVRNPTVRPTRFVLIADDFGLVDGVSRSILELLAAGRLSGTSVMANMPGAAELGVDLAAFRQRADLGLHLTLTLGRPLGPMPVLCPGGAFPAFGPLARRALAGGFLAGAARAELEAEIARQVEAYATAVGELPGHVDGHQHVHVLPGIRSALLAVIARTPGWRPWLRDSGDRPGAVIARGICVPKALVLSGLSLGFGRAARAAGLETNAGFSGVSAFNPGRDYAAVFARYLMAPGPRHLVMCHPGHPDADLARLDPVVATRPLEHAVLAGPRFPEILADAHMALCRFAEL